MNITISLEEFNSKWELYKINKHHEVYISSNIYGIVQYEDNEFVVIKIINGGI